MCEGEGLRCLYKQRPLVARGGLEHQVPSQSYTLSLGIVWGWWIGVGVVPVADCDGLSGFCFGHLLGRLRLRLDPACKVLM